jgi:hypothetical protein
MTPTKRLLVALAAIHAARPMHLTTLTLDDVDLPNRRLTIGGKSRRLDDLTHRLLLDYLHYRQRRWPRTTNHHLLLTEQRAHDQGPVSTYWLNDEFRAIGAWTANSKRPSLTAPTHSTSSLYSASPRTPQSATPAPPNNSYNRPLKATTSQILRLRHGVAHDHREK